MEFKTLGIVHNPLEISLDFFYFVFYIAGIKPEVPFKSQRVYISGND